MTGKKKTFFHKKKQQIANNRNEYQEDNIIFVFLFVYRFENLSKSETHKKSSKNSLRINPPSTYNVFLSFGKMFYSIFAYISRKVICITDIDSRF